MLPNMQAWETKSHDWAREDVCRKKDTCLLMLGTNCNACFHVLATSCVFGKAACFHASGASSMHAFGSSAE